MMKLTLGFLIILLSQSLQAMTYRIGEKDISAVRCPKQTCLISKACLENDKMECQALKALKKKVKSDTGPGGTNPGSSVCQKSYNGSVFIATDEKKNQVAFCQFRDGSFLSLDGLWVW